MGSNRFEFSRADRVRKALMKEIADILRTEVKDPTLANEVISVTDVELSGDLGHAKVYLSIFGEVEHQQAIMEKVTGWTPRIRSAVGKRIRLHHTPEIIFFLDNSLERGTHVTELLNKISRGEV